MTNIACRSITQTAQILFQINYCRCYVKHFDTFRKSTDITLLLSKK